MEINIPDRELKIIEETGEEILSKVGLRNEEIQMVLLYQILGYIENISRALNRLNENIEEIFDYEQQKSKKHGND
jgi:hypothetical protein